MFPYFSGDDFADGDLVYVELYSKCCLCNVASSIAIADAYYYVSGEFSRWVSLSTRFAFGADARVVFIALNLPTFTVPIPHIVLVCSKEEVIDSRTISPITPMTNTDAVMAAVVRDWAVGDYPRDSMGI
jgi:hypothetical protein